MKICVLAETTVLDIEVYKRLVYKIIKHIEVNEEIQFINPELDFSSKSQMLTQLPFTLDLLHKTFGQIDLVVLVVDCDTLSLREQHSILMKILDKSNSYLKDKLAIGIAKRNIEAWLLADHNAIIKTTGDTSIGEYPKAESIENPKMLLKEKWTRLTTYSEFLIKIAEESNIKVIRRNSTCFDNFYREITRVIAANKSQKTQLNASSRKNTKVKHK